MPPRKQKVVVSKPRKTGRHRKHQSATPNPETKTKRVLLKLKLNSKLPKDQQTPVSEHQDSLDAPGVCENAEDDNSTIMDGHGMRRGERQRKKVHQPDMAFGSEMDHLITSSVTQSKVKTEGYQQIQSSPPTILDLRTPALPRYNSPDTIQGVDPPPSRYAGTMSQDVQDIINTLRSSSDIQVDLPNMYVSGGTGVSKAYTPRLLFDLYIQCYRNQLWHFCDLVADTWIRALQTANGRTQMSRNAEDHMWRQNKVLERKFAEKKKGFKEDVFEFGLDIEDPDMASDVAAIKAEHLHDLYTHTNLNCGARLLWADAISLCGKKIEHDITKWPTAWPDGLFFDVMCTSLRMVGRKLTLKIEERYEGAWCRYHEHYKHGLPCYRKLAWEQKANDDGEIEGNVRARADAYTDAEEVEANLNGTKGKKRVQLSVGGEVQSDAKRVRFDSGPGSEAEIIDFGELGGGDKSEDKDSDEEESEEER